MGFIDLRGLTLRAALGMHCDMKRLLQLLLSTVLVLGSASLRAQEEDTLQAEVLAEEIPAAVVESAKAAVEALGLQVQQGRFHVALERMNPHWKARYAERVGGIEELERQLNGVADAMRQNGITMLSCKPQGEPVAYGVTPAQKQVQLDGKLQNRLVYTQWLVLVPTVSQFRIMYTQEGEPPRWVRIESKGFQVAIADREKLDWTFIDGAGVKVNDLRSLFATLPQDMKLPEISKKEIR